MPVRGRAHHDHRGADHHGGTHDHGGTAINGYADNDTDHELAAAVLGLLDAINDHGDPSDADLGRFRAYAVGVRDAAQRAIDAIDPDGGG